MDLPVRIWTLEGKTIRAEAFEGQVLRLGPRRLVTRLGAPLAPLANVRLRLRFPALGQDSEEIYGKVVGIEREQDSWVARITFTSIDTADQRILESLLRSPAPAS